MVLTKESIKKLRAVKRAILAEPDLYNQDTFTGCANSKNACETACCIAGWSVWLDSPKKFVKSYLDGDWLHMGAESLGLADREGLLAEGLFNFAACWPEPFASRYYAVDTPRNRAEVCADRIEHFIKTGGVE